MTDETNNQSKQNRARLDEALMRALRANSARNRAYFGPERYDAMVRAAKEKKGSSDQAHLPGQL